MIITRAQPAAVPKKTERKSGLRMALLMDCIAAMPPAAGRRARACITATEKAKKSPAINPHPSAVTNVTVNRKPSTIAIMPPADRRPTPKHTCRGSAGAWSLKSHSAAAVRGSVAFACQYRALQLHQPDFFAELCGHGLIALAETGGATLSWLPTIMVTLA